MSGTVGRDQTATRPLHGRLARGRAGALAGRVILLSALAAFAAVGHVAPLLPLAAFAGVMCACSFVPPAVWQLLEEERHGEEKDWLASDYEWFASLFVALCLTGFLAELAQRALASDDPRVRRVGERVREELPH